MLGAAHILLLLLAALGIVFLLHIVHALPPARARRTVCAAALLVPALELTHSVWLWATGVSHLVQLLPLHLCGIQSLFIPLAVFTRRTCFQDFVYATSLLGGVFGILFPAGVADYYPVLSFQTIQTVLLHMLLIFVPLALIRTGEHLPSLHRFPRVLCIFFAVALVVGTVDRIFGENYMFLYEAPAGTPLVWVFGTFGRPVYLIVTFLLLAGASLLIHLPFALRQRQVERAVRQRA
ncbi:MAG: TIGR02206 family membrane protein [Eubacteriales bacterium]|nr:TIGR02206 family membrane protein [Eubacteriales bacterium]